MFESRNASSVAARATAGDQDPEESLFRRTVTGGFWSTFNILLVKLLGGLKTVILARLLTSADFGLIGLGLVVIGTVNRFSYPGIYTALIQKEKLDADDLSAGWWMHAGRGILLFILIFPASSLIADFYAEPRLVQVLRFLSLTFLLEGFQSIALVRLNRSLNFRRLLGITQLAAVAGFIVAVGLAWYLRNYWALVAAHLVQIAVYTAATYFVAPFRPRARFDRTKARQLFRFGRQVFIAGILTYGFMRGNEFLLGKIVGVEILGFYALAITFVGLVAAPIEDLIQTVAFPALASIQREEERLRAAYLRVFRTATLLSTVLLLGLPIVAKDLILLVLGAKWMPILTTLVWLSFFHWFHALGSTLHSLYTALGRVTTLSKLRLFQFLCYAAGILPAVYSFGNAGAAFWICMVALLVLIVHFGLTASILPGLWREALGVFLGYWPLLLAQAALLTAGLLISAGWVKLLSVSFAYVLAVALFLYWRERPTLGELLTAGMGRLG